MACPRCKQTHQTAEEVKACLAEWQRTRGVTPIKELIERSSLGTPEAKRVRAQADPKVVQRVLARVDELEAKKVTDRGARGVGRFGELEVVPGVHALTKKAGFFAFARAVIGNFPVCWRPTEKEARERGEEFMRETEEARKKRG